MITLTATLQDYSGGLLGTTASPAFLRIALCGAGPFLPRVAGTAMIVKVASWPLDIPVIGGAASVQLYGNDAITPNSGPFNGYGTYYLISVLDTGRNVLQSAAYSLTGSGTQDLSNLSPLIFGTGVAYLQSPLLLGTPTPQACTGTVNGTNPTFTFSAPASPTPLIALFVGGVFQNSIGGTPDYTLAYSGSNIWTLTMTTPPVVGPVTALVFPQGGSRTITSPQTINVSGAVPDKYVYCNFSTPGTIALPSPATAGATYQLTFKDVSNNASTNVITFSGTIGAGDASTIANNNGSLTFVSDGAAWRVTAKV